MSPCSGYGALQESGEDCAKEIYAYLGSIDDYRSAGRWQVGTVTALTGSLALAGFVSSHELGLVDEVIEVAAGTAGVVSGALLLASTVARFLIKRDFSNAPPDITAM